ncbi:MAG: hypothetical protein PVSMB1_15120 [Gemmatimonadaceae bacterium]
MMAPAVHDQTPPTLRALLEHGLERDHASTGRIVSVARVGYFRSSHSCARLMVTFDNGEQLPVVAKRLRPGIKSHGNEQEVLTYRRLLRDRRFGAPALHGSVYDSQRRRYVLLLEDVGNESLVAGDLDEWRRAVLLLAEVHAEFLGHEDELQSLRCLHDHDAVYFGGIVNEANSNLSRAGIPVSQRRFAALREPISRLVQVLCRGPRTLVHGDLIPDNVMLDSGANPRLIDWESAAIGQGALDLVTLLEGWTGDAREKLIISYRQKLSQLVGDSDDLDGFLSCFRASEIFQPVRYLAWDLQYCGDSATASQLLDTLEHGLDVVEGAVHVG